VNTNYSDIIAGTSDGTKDFSISALTCAGTVSMNGNVTLGNASGDDITITGSIAADIPLKTDGSYDIGSSSLGLDICYFGDGGGNTVGIDCPAIASNFIFTLPAFSMTMPTADGADKDYMETDGSGAISFVGGPSITSKTTTYTATTADKVISVQTSSAWTLTLYAASGNAGRTLDIVKTSSDYNALTIDGNSSETINGGTTTSINTQYERLSIRCDGSNWHIMNRNSCTKWTSFTPTGSWTSNTTYAGFWRRVGDSLEFMVDLSLSGAPTSTSLTITIPNSLTVDSAKRSNATYFGSCSWQDAGTRSGIGQVRWNNTTTVALHALDETSPTNLSAITQAFPHTWASGDSIEMRFTVPISGWKGDVD
jgi:hypothetical protein